MRSMKILTILAAAAVVAATWTPVFGSSLVSMSVLDPTDSTTAYSSPYAVSQDGTYVAGESQASGGTIRVPVVWSLSDGLVALPNPSGANSRAIGVVKGVGSNAGAVIVIGLHEGYLTQRYYNAPVTSLASGSWADCALAGGLPVSDMRGGSYNDLRNAVPDYNNATHPGGWPPLGAWFTAGKLSSNGRDARLRGDPFVAWDGASPRNVTSVSTYNVGTGRGSETPSAAYYEGPAEAYTQVPGSGGYRADGIGISPGFGASATNSFTFPMQWICGQVQNYSTNIGGTVMLQAFRWRRGDNAMTFLGSLAPAGGGDNGDNSATAYTVADNGVTAGRSFFGASAGNPSYEVATLWDTSGAWDTTGTAQDIKALLSAKGVDTSAWTRLIRVFACSDDGRVLAGYGTWAADNSTRGFIATITPPGTPVVNITSISYNGTTVTIGFTCSTTWETPATFVVQEASTLATTPPVFTDITAMATVVGGAGSFQATFPPSGDPRFYRIKHL